MIKRTGIFHVSRNAFVVGVNLINIIARLRNIDTYICVSGNTAISGILIPASIGISCDSVNDLAV